MQAHGLYCNAGGCVAKLIWLTQRGEKAPTKAVMESHARKEGWHAPDRLGNHWCPAHRRQDGVKRT